MGLPLRKYFGSSKYAHTWNTLLKKITKPKDGCWFAIKEGRASAALRFRQTSRGVLVLKSLIPCILAWHDYVKTDEAKSRAIELALPSFSSVSAPAVFHFTLQLMTRTILMGRETFGAVGRPIRMNVTTLDEVNETLHGTDDGVDGSETLHYDSYWDSMSELWVAPGAVQVRLTPHRARLCT
jgi:hypothetical protein